jgi:hypothetical protein
MSARMKPAVLALSLIVAPIVSGGCSKPESEFAGAKIVLFDPRKIEASLEERVAWVRAQKGRNAQRFDEDYGWILKSNTIGQREAQQLAYLFFYSSDQACGDFSDGVLHDGVWTFAYNNGTRTQPPLISPPVHVDAATGHAWQEGQTTRVDTLALIRGR